MTMFLPTEEEVTISATCKKVFNSHKLTRELKKSKGNMTLPIVKIEFHNSVPKSMISTTNKTKIMVLLTLKLKSPSLWHKPKAVKLEWKSQKPFQTQDRVSSTTLHPLLKATLATDLVVKENLMIQSWLLTNFIQMKMRNSFSKESKKWSNLCFMVITPTSNQKWKVQLFIPTDNQEQDLDFMIPTKQLKKTELITLIRLIRK